MTAATPSLANDTYLHFNDPKFEPCAWPNWYPVGLMDTPRVELDLRHITVADILHLMSVGTVTMGCPSSKSVRR